MRVKGLGLGTYGLGLECPGLGLGLEILALATDHCENYSIMSLSIQSSEKTKTWC